MEEPIEAVVSVQPPIDQLPDELLGAIFVLNTVKEVEDGHLLHDPHATTLSSLLVCKRWHGVVMNYPELWVRIIDYDKHPPRWIEELLRRSKASLIEVGEDSVFKHVQLRFPRGKIVLHHIFKDTSRIKTLSLQIRLAPWEYICQNFLQYPASNIEYLNLITACPFPDYLFPGSLFADKAPHLRRLHLQRCLIDFSSHVLSNLTDLSVLDIVAPPGITVNRTPDHPLKVAPTVRGWLRVLENIPSLLYLTLSGAITEAHDGEEPLPNVKLSHLLFLTVGAGFQDGVSLLEQLSIPPSCGIRLKFNRSSSGLDGRKLLAFLSNQLSHWPRDSPDRYLQAKILSDYRIHFGNSRRVGHVWDMTEEDVIEEHAQSSADPVLWLVISLASTHDTLTIFNQLLALYDSTYPTTTTLDLWLDEEFATINANAVTFPTPSSLHSFTAVKTLNLLGRSPLYLLPLFQYSFQPNQPLFPALRSLRLTRTNFEDDQRAAYFTVIAFLLWRAEVNMRLVELQIIESKMNKDTEESLSRLGNVKITLGSLKLPIDYAPDDD